MLFDIKELIFTVGYLGLFGIVFAESGLFFGFFLPGDSLLVTAGLLASQGFFQIEYLTIVLPIAAILGDSVGYWFGRKVGHRIFNRENSLLFDKKNLQKAHSFYKKHGGKTIILARFIPIIRTFAPIVAGSANMEYKLFLIFNVFGGILWTLSMLFIGFYLGNLIPDVDKYMIPIIGVIIFLSIIPGIIEAFKHNKEKIAAKLIFLKEKIAAKLKKLILKIASKNF